MEKLFKLYKAGLSKIKIVKRFNGFWVYRYDDYIESNVKKLVAVEICENISEVNAYLNNINY